MVGGVLLSFQKGRQQVAGIQSVHDEKLTQSGTHHVIFFAPDPFFMK